MDREGPNGVVVSCANTFDDRLCVERVHILGKPELNALYFCLINVAKAIFPSAVKPNEDAGNRK